MKSIIDREVQGIVASLPVPYPEKHYFGDELKDGIESYANELINKGTKRSDAIKQAIESFRLQEEDAIQLETLYQSRFQKILTMIPTKIRKPLGEVLQLAPIAALFAFLYVEAPNILFIHLGGAPNLLILAIGGVTIIFQIHRFFLWFVKRDHSADSLARNDKSALLVAGLLIALGLFSTALNYFIVLEKFASGLLTTEDFRWGMVEPLSCMIIASALAVMLISIHGLIQYKLKLAGVPGRFMRGHF
jgi:hypothetical protein